MEEGQETSSPFEAIHRWSARLIDATGEGRLQVDREGLQGLCLALGAARGLYFGFRDGDTTAIVEAEWKTPDLPSAIGAEYTEAEAGGLFSLLRSEQIIACFVDGDEPDLAPLRGILETERLVADLIVPVQQEGVLVRAIVIDFASPPRVSAPALHGIGAAVRDLLAAAERRSAIDAAWRQRLQDQAHQHKLQSLGTMVGGILHDVNNVFQIVTGMSELLLAETNPAVQRSMVKDIESAVDRGAGLCHRILVYSRQGVRPQQTFRLGPRLEELAPLLRAAVPEDRIFTFDVEAGDRTVTMPAVELEHALINLCNNAVDATQAGAHITISCRFDDDGSWATITVSDTGHGMDATTLEHAKEAFYTTKPLGAGTGLGLAMVQRAFADAGGMLTLESEAGVGTTATLRLPTADIKPQNTALLQDAGGGDETLLLVEDDAMILRVTASALRRRGYTVLTAAHGAEALPLFQAHREAIQLVITDVVMPHVGGVALHTALADLGASTPFLFATGYDAGQINDEFTPGGDWALLLKPYTTGALQVAIRRLLDR